AATSSSPRTQAPTSTPSTSSRRDELGVRLRVGRRRSSRRPTCLRSRRAIVVRYLVRRMLWAAVLFVAVTLVAYVLFFLIPNNPARIVAGQAATNAEII